MVSENSNLCRRSGEQNVSAGMGFSMGGDGRRISGFICGES